MSNNEHQKYPRVFVAEYESADKWTKRGRRSLLRATNNTDHYLIFKTGNAKDILGPATVALLGEMENICEMIDVGILQDDDYRQFVCSKVLSCTDPETEVYFLSMEDTYAFVREQLENKGYERVFASVDFDICMRKKLSGTRKNGKKSKQKKTAMASGENDSLFSTMIDLCQINPNVHMPGEDLSVNQSDIQTDKDSAETNMHKESCQTEAGSKPQTHTKTQPEQEKVINQKSEDLADKTKPETKREKEEASKTVQKQADDKDIEQKHEAEKKDMSSEKAASSSGIPKAPPPPSGNAVSGTAPTGGRAMAGRGMRQRPGMGPMVDPYDGKTRQEIENEIFQVNIDSKLEERIYTEESDAKAAYIVAMHERLIRHIQTLNKDIEKFGFDDKAYQKLIITLVRSKDYSDFIISWDCTMPGKALGLDEKTYKYLKEEACYFNSMCESVYGKDRWANT